MHQTRLNCQYNRRLIDSLFVCLANEASKIHELQTISEHPRSVYTASNKSRILFTLLPNVICPREATLSLN
jgi:hypothetical protein